MWGDPRVTRFIGGKPSTAPESWSRLLRYRGLWPVLGYGYWCVRERRSGRYVGDVGFADFRRGIVPSIDGIPEAGWAIAPSAAGQGFATEALRAALAWLDGNVAAPRSLCLIAAENEASAHVARKAGYQPSGEVTAGDQMIPLWSRMRP